MTFIQINDQQLAGYKQDLAELKKANQLIDETVALKQDQLRMHNLLSGSIVTLQEIIELCELGLNP